MKFASLSFLLILFTNIAFANELDFMNETERLLKSGVLKKVSIDSMPALESYRNKLIKAKVDNANIDYLAYSSALLILDRADLKQSKHLVCIDLEAKAKKSFLVATGNLSYPNFTWPILKVIEQICD